MLSFIPLCFLLLQVSVVGVVRGFAPFVTNIQYSVDDMTGPPLNVKQWVNTEVGSINRLCSELLHYCAVVVNNQFQMVFLTGLCSDDICFSRDICEGYGKSTQFQCK